MGCCIASRRLCYKTRGRNEKETRVRVVVTSPSRQIAGFRLGDTSSAIRRLVWYYNNRHGLSGVQRHVNLETSRDLTSGPNFGNSPHNIQRLVIRRQSDEGG